MERSRLLQQVLLLQGQQAILDAHAAILVVRRRSRRQKRCSYIWVRRWLSAERRLQYGQYERLMAELRMEDVHSLFTFLRMQPEMFDKLLNSVGPIGLKVKRTTRYGENLWNQVYIKLAITLRHLAAGDEYPTLQFCFRVARTQFRLSFQSCARQLLKNIWMKLLLALLPQMNGGT